MAIKPSPAQKIAATLYDGNKLVTDAKAEANVPALKPGEEVAITLQIPC